MSGGTSVERSAAEPKYHLLGAGHFALETEGDTIAGLMRDFLGKHVK